MIRKHGKAVGGRRWMLGCTGSLRPRTSTLRRAAAWRRIAPLSCALPLVITACSGEGSGAGAVASFTERDSAGVAILVTPGPDAFAPLGWHVDTVPDLVLGHEDSPSGFFHHIQGMKALPDGKLLVLDGGTHELRLFDAGGRLVERAGRHGRGPGEFREPVLVPSADVDSILIFDKGNSRFQLFPIDLQGNTTQRLEGWGGGRRHPLGAVGRLALRERSIYAAGGYEAARKSKGYVDQTMEFFWYDPATGPVRALDSFPVVRAYVDDHGSAHLPFSSAPTGAVGADVALITDSRRFEVRGFDLTGRLIRILRIDEPPRPITQEALDGWMNSKVAKIAESRAAGFRERYGKLPLPDAQPAFQSLIVDEDGWLWAQVYGWDPAEPKKWVVFDPQGRARGTVRTPADLEVHSIAPDHVLGLWRGAFNAEYVHRYRLRRNGR